MSTPSDTPDVWATQSSRLPLAFAQVREDPRLDLEIISQLPDHPVIVMIASGGETAIQVARYLPAELHLVDMNPAQLAITRLKWSLAETCSVAESRALLGHDAMDPRERGVWLAQLLEQLSLPSDIFGPPGQVAEWGPDLSGRYERTFAELQRELAPIAGKIQRVLESSDESPGATAFFEPITESGQIFDAAFDRVMSLENLVCLFGKDATQNPRQSFAAHFAWRTRLSLSRPDRTQNPFLWQLLVGRFPSTAAYDWLLPSSRDQPFQPLMPRLHSGRMVDVLQSFAPASVDLVHLSNILDWLSPGQATETLRCAYHVLKPGGRLILRQLNSTLWIPDLDSQLTWDLSLGNRMAEQDRSFFYPAIFVGVRE
ncbi:MAG: DUF3419 family protein [Planctomycetaceae bacterium]